MNGLPFVDMDGCVVVQPGRKFIGQYPRTVHEKGRVTIPAKIRDALEEGVVVTRGLDGCLFMFPAAEWDRLADRISELPLTNPTARAFTRFMFANACDCKPDRQGRILIPKYLLELAGISEEAVIIGSNSHLELWSPGKFEETQSHVEQDPDYVIGRFAELGI